MDVEPWPDTEVIDETPEIEENCRSSIAATEDDMTSGLAPGRLADTLIVGKSTLGKAAIGSLKYEKTPKILSAKTIKVVMTGRRMQSSEIDINPDHSALLRF